MAGIIDNFVLIGIAFFVYLSWMAITCQIRINNLISSIASWVYGGGNSVDSDDVYT